MWPKKLPELTNEQKIIREDFMIRWHRVLPNQYSIIEKFNHIWAFKKKKLYNCKTLDIGAGLGGHIKHEDLSKQEYYALELREDMAKEIELKYPTVKTIVGDIQKKIDFTDNYFDRIIAAHVLEHLPDLPAALLEIRRLLKKGGIFEIVIPCEGGLIYSFARKISAQRLFEKTYKMSYDWFIKCEHINNYKEILTEIKKVGFSIKWKRFFPFPLPLYFINLAVGLRCGVLK